MGVYHGCGVRRWYIGSRKEMEISKCFSIIANEKNWWQRTKWIPVKRVLVSPRTLCSSPCMFPIVNFTVMLFQTWNNHENLTWILIFVHSWPLLTLLCSTAVNTPWRTTPWVLLILWNHKAEIVFDNLSLCELKYFSASESQSWCSKAEHDQSFLWRARW